MSLEFFEHVYSPTFRARSARPPGVDPEIEIIGDNDAGHPIDNIAEQLGCKPEEVQGQLQDIQAMLIGGGLIPTPDDLRKVRECAAQEHGEVMARIRERARGEEPK